MNIRLCKPKMNRYSKAYKEIGIYYSKEEFGRYKKLDYYIVWHTLVFALYKFNVSFFMKVTKKKKKKVDYSKESPFIESEKEVIHVEGFGEAVIDDEYGFIDVYSIEEDGMEKWLLFTPEKGEKVLRTAEIFPLDIDRIMQILDNPEPFGLNLDNERDMEIYERLEEIMEEELIAGGYNEEEE